ncbi:hypothetical protein [Actinomadura verrucosospora]|uniref:Uncharacterized protein n=1 Tax=Actinomadura verrucosospora TaxID=46165 RepID=A0A7D3ZEJ0_ACTVE|nr:hypothetical protein [Actinomadura verrucosospora]QKG21077.1 hypothetical protein ACTIVE_2715 [Actinomadura verrucosospora]
MTILNRKPPTSDAPDSPEELARELQRQRELADARRVDELERLRAETGHGRARADVAEESQLAELARAERAADVQAEAELARMHRQFRAAGERTRVKALMARSGEARALRLEWLRSRNLHVLVPLLVGFGIWSTTGVQQGAARIMQVDSHSPVWWALWGLEALLIGTVCWIIVVRARLAGAGGELSRQAEKIGVGCLTTSVLLNLVAAVPTGHSAHVSVWAVMGAMFAHALGPVGAAVTAHLIGVIDRSISTADPWHDKDGRAMPRLAEMDLQSAGSALAERGAAVPPLDASDSAKEGDAERAGIVPVMAWPVASGQRRILPVIARPATPQTTAEGGETTPRIGDDRPQQRKSEAPRKRRPNKGVRVPESAKPAPPRALTDEQQCERMVAAIDRGELPEDASIRQVQSALGLGFARAKKVKELYAEQLADIERAIVQALPEPDEPPATSRAELSVVGGER